MPHVSDAPSPGTSPGTLASITCPDRLDTPFGSLDFFDGMPSPDAVSRSYDTLDLLRGIEAFLNCVPGASMVAMRRGLRSIGVDSRTIGYTAPRCTSAPVVLTGNTETTYGMTFLALDEDGPTVIEAPGNSLCIVNDMWQRYVTDMGIAGPDRGEGGKYLFLPPGHVGDVPDGYFVVRPATYGSWVLFRALGGTESLLTARVYPLSAAADRPEQRFLNWAESDFNTVHANDISFFEEIDTIVQAEPPESLDPERAGQLAALGIERGKPFRPDDRMRSILDTAARIASGVVRTLALKPRDPGFFYYSTVRGRPRSPRTVTNFCRRTVPGCWTPGRCSTTSPPPPRRRWSRRPSAPDRSTPTRRRTPRASGSTADGRTRSLCRAVSP